MSVKVIAVASGKGGVGKSTVAANLAYIIASRGKKVGLVDLDIDGSNIPKVIGMSLTEPAVGETQVKPIEYHGVKVMSMANIVLNDDLPLLLRGERKQRFTKDLLNAVDWGSIEYLICDMPPAAGDVTITLLESLGDSIHGVVVVTTPSRVALTDVRKTVSLCKKFGLRIIGIVNNMSRAQCKHCGKSSDIFGGRENVDKLTDDFGVKVLVDIPMSEEIEINPFALSSYYESVADEAMKWRLFG